MLLCDHWGGASPRIAGHGGCHLSLLPGALSSADQGPGTGGKVVRVGRSGDSLLQPPHPPQNLGGLFMGKVKGWGGTVCPVSHSSGASTKPKAMSQVKVEQHRGCRRVAPTSTAPSLIAISNHVGFSFGLNLTLPARSGGECSLQPLLTPWTVCSL